MLRSDCQKIYRSVEILFSARQFGHQEDFYSANVAKNYNTHCSRTRYFGSQCFSYPPRSTATAFAIEIMLFDLSLERVSTLRNTRNINALPTYLTDSILTPFGILKTVLATPEVTRLEKSSRVGLSF